MDPLHRRRRARARRRGRGTRAARAWRGVHCLSRAFRSACGMDGVPRVPSLAQPSRRPVRQPDPRVDRARPPGGGASRWAHDRAVRPAHDRPLRVRGRPSCEARARTSRCCSPRSSATRSARSCTTTSPACTRVAAIPHARSPPGSAGSRSHGARDFSHLDDQLLMIDLLFHLLAQEQVTVDTGALIDEAAARASAPSRRSNSRRLATSSPPVGPKPRSPTRMAGGVRS